MQKYIFTYTCIFAVLSSSSALAHSTIGDRVFPATLAIDDPGISDELTLPQINRFKQAGDNGGPAAWRTSTSAEFDKRLTENLGIAVGGAWLDNSGASGWDNFSAGAKYVFLKNTDHEFLMSAGLDWDIGNTGARRAGAESFSTLTPALFFGKGMGDLPDSMNWLKPVAVTGTLGYAMPTRNFSTDPDSGDETRNPQNVRWGLTFQYSFPYLQQHVKDIGLSAPFDTAIPIVEFAFATPTSGIQSARTTGTINPGVIFMGTDIQLGLEAQLPLNNNSGSGVGYLAQLHFYLDNIFPTSIGKTL